MWKNHHVLFRQPAGGAILFEKTTYPQLLRPICNSQQWCFCLGSVLSQTQLAVLAGGKPVRDHVLVAALVIPNG